MKKIPGLFVRDFSTGLVIDEVTPGCEWVIGGEGIGYRKWDGTCCMIRGGVLYRRHDRKLHRKTGERKPAPPDWEACEESPNEHTGHWPGWVPVGDGPGERWHREAFEPFAGNPVEDGTYELCGPKLQANPERLNAHELIPHTIEILNAARDFYGLCMFLETYDVEGVVWHHPDGRMCKVKGKDFGISRPPKEKK